MIAWFNVVSSLSGRVRITLLSQYLFDQLRYYRGVDRPGAYVQSSSGDCTHAVCMLPPRWWYLVITDFLWGLVEVASLLGWSGWLNLSVYCAASIFDREYAGSSSLAI